MAKEDLAQAQQGGKQGDSLLSLLIAIILAKPLLTI